MTEHKAELLLEAMTNAQDRLIYYLSLGFAIGFVVGFLGAWILVTWR